MTSISKVSLRVYSPNVHKSYATESSKSSYEAIFYQFFIKTNFNYPKKWCSKELTLKPLAIQFSLLIQMNSMLSWLAFTGKYCFMSALRHQSNMRLLTIFCRFFIWLSWKLFSIFIPFDCRWDEEEYRVKKLPVGIILLLLADALTWSTQWMFFHCLTRRQWKVFYPRFISILKIVYSTCSMYSPLIVKWVWWWCLNLWPDSQWRLSMILNF